MRFRCKAVPVVPSRLQFATQTLSHGRDANHNAGMHAHALRFAMPLLTFCCFGCITAGAEDSRLVGSQSAALDSAAIRAVMKRVADWQLVNPSASSNRYTEDCWTWGAFYTG